LPSVSSVAERQFVAEMPSKKAKLQQLQDDFNEAVKDVKGLTASQ
jgi:hypothetical protein